MTPTITKWSEGYPEEVHHVADFWRLVRSVILC